MNVQSLYKFDNEKWTKYLTIIFIMNIVKHDTTTFTFTAWPIFSKSIIHVWIFRFEFAFNHWINLPSIARQVYVSSDWTKHLGQFFSLEACLSLTLQTYTKSWVNDIQIHYRHISTNCIISLTQTSSQIFIAFT